MASSQYLFLKMKKNLLLAVVLTAVGAQGVSAAILTQVPMQGSMAMPMVSYHADDGTIHVMMPNVRAAAHTVAGEQSKR